MAGLRSICKQLGSLEVDGVLWIWDYVNNEPRKKSEMTKDEIRANKLKKIEINERAHKNETTQETPPKPRG